MTLEVVLDNCRGVSKSNVAVNAVHLADVSGLINAINDRRSGCELNGLWTPAGNRTEVLSGDGGAEADGLTFCHK